MTLSSPTFWESFIVTLVPQLLILILSLIGWFFWARSELKRLADQANGFQNIQNNHGNKISELIGSINASLKLNITALFTTNSPLKLSNEVEALLQKVDFYNFFESIKDPCVKALEKLNLKTRYDIQEKSREYLQEIKDEDIFIPLKTKVYEEGMDYWSIIIAASIPLRDYYLQQHPEITD